MNLFDRHRKFGIVLFILFSFNNDSYYSEKAYEKITHLKKRIPQKH